MVLSIFYFQTLFGEDSQFIFFSRRLKPPPRHHFTILSCMYMLPKFFTFFVYRTHWVEIDPPGETTTTVPAVGWLHILCGASGHDCVRWPKTGMEMVFCWISSWRNQWVEWALNKAGYFWAGVSWRPPSGKSGRKGWGESSQTLDTWLNIPMVIVFVPLGSGCGTPKPNGRTSWLIKGVLTTYKSWDDPPSRGTNCTTPLYREYNTPL